MAGGRSLVRRLSAVAVLAAALAAPVAAQPGQQNVVRVAYFYKVRWGFQEEFERLFFKNHYPILAAQTKSDGRIRNVSVKRPQFHGDGRADWTLLVEITFADWNALKNGPDEATLAKGIFSDLETWRKEEKRRFEILDAHWDVPLNEVAPPR
jgi:hypothetical protein